jgi:hypothetical protein
MVYTVHTLGTTYYNGRITKRKIKPKVFDIGARHLPDWQNNQLLKYVADFIAYIMPVLLGAEIALEQAEYIIVIYGLRYIFNLVTILPKQTDCDDTKFGLNEVIFGHCYDKIFSGHTASVVLLALLLHKHKGYSAFLLALGIVVYGIVIICLRYHYTIDVLVAIVVTLLVFQNNVKFPLRLN